MKTENYFLNKKKKRIRIQFIIKSFSIEVNFQQQKMSTCATNSEFVSESSVKKMEKQ